MHGQHSQVPLPDGGAEVGILSNCTAADEGAFQHISNHQFNTQQAQVNMVPSSSQAGDLLHCTLGPLHHHLVS
jgi:hypothetical protein